MARTTRPALAPSNTLATLPPASLANHLEAAGFRAVLSVQRLDGGELSPSDQARVSELLAGFEADGSAELTDDDSAAGVAAYLDQEQARKGAKGSPAKASPRASRPASKAKAKPSRRGAAE